MTWQIVDGTPGGVPGFANATMHAFNELTRTPLLYWNHIMCVAEVGVPHGAGSFVSPTAFPTFTHYENGVVVGLFPQAPTPLPHFSGLPPYCPSMLPAWLGPGTCGMVIR